MQKADKQKLAKVVGARMRMLRKKKGHSQEKFADEVNADRTYVCKIENGHCNLTVWKLCEICGLLGITLKEFFSNDEFSKQYFNRQEENNELD